EDHTDEVWFVAFSNNGRFLASASKDKVQSSFDSLCICVCIRIISYNCTEQTIKIWEFRHRDEGHVVAVESGSLDSESTEEADQVTATLFATLIGHEDTPHRVCWSPDHAHLLSCSSQPTILLWNINKVGFNNNTINCFQFTCSCLYLKRIVLYATH